MWYEPHAGIWAAIERTHISRQINHWYQSLQEWATP